MSEKQRKKQKRTLLLIFGGAALAMILISSLVIMLVFMDDSGSRRKRVHTVTLLKPPPPPKIEETPPPPPEKKEEIIEEPEPEDAPQDVSEDIDAPPPGELLGLDADGSAGGDSFGQVARKGGRSIIGGDGTSLLAKYSWYTRVVRDELEKLVRKRLAENGGIPKGELKVIVALKLDNLGKVTDYRLVNASGNDTMDRAVEEALNFAVMRDPPPPDMPRVIKLKIVSQG